LTILLFDVAETVEDNNVLGAEFKPDYTAILLGPLMLPVGHDIGHLIQAALVENIP
jgi:hypothetical protein